MGSGHLNKSMRLSIAVAILAFLNCSQTAPAESAAPPADQGRDIEDVWQRPSSTSSLDTVYNMVFKRPTIKRHFALIVGLSDYYKAWRPLEAPYQDALHVRNFLIDSGFDYVVTLTNKKATKNRIEEYMEDIFPSMIGKDDEFIFYFSGHGKTRHVGEKDRGYLPMLDSKSDNFASMISMDDITVWNENLSDVRHVLFVLDSCFSGLAGRQSKDDAVSSMYMDDLLMPSHVLLTAGADKQPAYGGSAWGGSLFTQYFLKGAKGAADSATADTGKDGIVSLSELYQYVRLNLAEESDKQNGVHQTPGRSELGNNDVGEFFFLPQPNDASPNWEASKTKTATGNASSESKGDQVGKQTAGVGGASGSSNNAGVGKITGMGIGALENQYDENYWREAKKAHSIPAVQHYLCRQIVHSHNEDAVTEIYQLVGPQNRGEPARVAEVYNKIKSVNNVGVLEAFMKMYPKNIQDADSRIAYLQSGKKYNFDCATVIATSKTTDNENDQTDISKWIAPSSELSFKPRPVIVGLNVLNQQRDKTYWASIRAKHSIPEMQQYLCSDPLFANEVVDEIDRLLEKERLTEMARQSAIFEIIKVTNDVHALDAYVARFPNSPRINEAKKQSEDMGNEIVHTLGQVLHYPHICNY